MNLKEHYNKLWDQSLQKFKHGMFEFDDLINSENDTRYGLTYWLVPQTAHVTAIRFKEPFADEDSFVNTVADLRNTNLGRCTTDQLELVGNDWYQQKEKTKLIEKFALEK